MSTLGVIGCILGFLIVIYLCYKDWSVYLATFAGACVVIACNTLPFIDSLVGDYVSGMFTAVKSFFFMILFGCLQSKIYTESGAAYTIADTVMNRLLKENMSNTGKNLIGMSVILVIGTILNLGGIIAGVVIVLMYPIALVIFERCERFFCLPCARRPVFPATRAYRPCRDVSAYPLFVLVSARKAFSGSGGSFGSTGCFPFFPKPHCLFRAKRFLPIKSRKEPKMLVPCGRTSLSAKE